MDWVDLVIVLYLALGVVSGLRRGFMLVLFSLAGYVVGVMVAAHFKAQVTATLLRQLPVTAWVHQLLPAPALASPSSTTAAVHLFQSLVGILVFLLIVGIVEFFGRLVGDMLTRLVTTFRVTGTLNRIGGGLAGLAEHGVVAALILTVIFAVPVLAHTPISRQVTQAPLAGALMTWFTHLAKIPGIRYL